MSRFTIGLLIVVGLFFVVQQVNAQEVDTEEEAPVKQEVSEPSSPESESIEEDVPQLEEDQEIIERGLKFRLGPKKKATKKSRIRLPKKKATKKKPRIKVPKRKQVKKKKFRLNPTDPGSQEFQLPPSFPPMVPNEVIVKLRPGRILPSTTMATLGLQEVDRIGTDMGIVVYRFTIPLGSELAPNPVTVAEMLRQLSAVEYVHPNFIYFHNTVLTGSGPERKPFDPHFPHQWHYFANGTGTGKSPGGIGLPSLWHKTTGNQGIIVAVLDTGIVQNHPDIQNSGNLLQGADMILDSTSAADSDPGRDRDPTDPGNGRTRNLCQGPLPLPNPAPNDWHGTHVAGTVGVGGTNNGIGVAGVNWRVKVLPIRVEGKCGSTERDLLNGILWAAGLPVPGLGSNTTPARVINISLGSPGSCSALIGGSQSYQRVINRVVNTKGAIVVVSAGNDGINANLARPGNCQNVITVGASDARGHMTSYSNWGSRVTIMAPGGDMNRDDNADGKPDGILSLFHPGEKPQSSILRGYAVFRGTSMAAPHVSGVIALWLAADPSLTFQEIRRRLIHNALPRTTAQCPRGCGAGLLNADLGFYKQVPIRWNNGKAFIFRGNSYARFDVAEDERDQAIRLISDGWGGLPPHFNKGVDAAIHWESKASNNKAYLFKGNSYVEWDMVTNALVGPRSIASGWPSLPSNFKSGLDAAVYWRHSHEAYFFKGNQYVRLNGTTRQKDKGPLLIGAQGADWQGLWPDGVDGAVYWNNGFAYFFKGNQYMRVNVFTRKTEGIEKRIKDGWKGLCALVDHCP